MVRPPAKPAAPPSGGEGTNFISIALFLLLLVFFLVMLADARPRSDRVAAVLESVEAQFGAAAAGAESPDGRIAGNSWREARETLGAIGLLLQTELRIAKVETTGRGRLLQVSLPVDQLLVPGTARVRPERTGLLHRIAAALARPPVGVVYQASFFLALGGRLRPGAGPMERAVAVGEALIGVGGPPALITIGLEEGEAGMARFLFAIEPAAPAAVSVPLP